MIETRLRDIPTDIPLGSKMVTVVRFGNVIEQAKTLTEKRAMAERISQGDTLVAVWTGQWSSDAFVLPYSQLLML